MSVIADNKAFVSTVLGVASPDFDKSTFGIWVSFFQHVNYSDSGYTLPQPLVEDIVASEFTVTGKRFSIVSPDGKAPKARFFITSGIKGLNGYDSLEPLAEITNTYISGYKPEILMPDMDFTGKIFRRTEILSSVQSPVTKENILSIAAEDWQQTNISVNVTNTEENFAYIDSGYSGYSNESATRYKFLYDDSSNSVESNFSQFELPIQLEASSVFKYRISRTSEPLGQTYFVDVTADGKGVIDYSQYKDEVSGTIDGSISYDFQNIANLNITEEALQKLAVSPIENDENLESLKISKSVSEDGSEFYDFNLICKNQDFDGIYKVGISLDRYKLSSKEGIVGYVMSSYNMGDGASTKTINLAQKDLVYPRVSENGAIYTSKNVSDLVDIQQISESESFAQDSAKQSAAVEESESKLSKTMDSYFEAFNDALNDKFGDEEPALEEDEETINEKIKLEQQDAQRLIDGNASIKNNETALPNFQLPKKIISSDFYSNYLNSGEKYVALPLSRYSDFYSSIAFGNNYGILGYKIEEAKENSFGTRKVYNSTCQGVFINEATFCKGDSATQRFSAPADNSIFFANGAVTEIPSSNGIILKDNYENELSWQNALNYFYTKNYLASFDCYPSFSETEYQNLFSQALTKVKQIVGGPSPSSSTDSFISNAGLEPRIFVEREIYTEEYNTDQLQEFNRSIFTQVLISDSQDLATKPIDKLYCVQSYDTSDFVRNKQAFFYPIQNYNENIIFDSFIPNSDISFEVQGENNFGTLLFSDESANPQKIYRAEYVTGSSSIFNYSNYSGASVWTGVNGSVINISNQDTKNYAYHLYTYNTQADAFILERSNVSNLDIANTSLSNGAVLKFTKQSFSNNLTKTKALNSSGEEIEYLTAFISVIDSNGNLYDAAKTKVNVQTYNYSIVSPEEVHQWYILNKNPINNNSFGLESNEQDNVIRFFQDINEESKEIARQLLLFPNGPSTSKNYEGTPVDISSINGLADGLYENNIYITEQYDKTSIYESNCSLDFEENGKIVKQKSPAQGSSSITLNEVRRLKITKVKYNFYTKDLVLIGDAGFPNSNQFNYGWQFKLQYRTKGSSENWKELVEKGEFDKKDISSQSSQISPFYILLGQESFLNSLQMMAFKTNLPLYLDDRNYEFRIAKYEKLATFSADLDIIKKVNFLPVKVQWTADPDCEYYNIYQKDTGNNITFLSTENTRTNLSYVVPDVKQSYVDLGVANFGSPNYSGYYDVVVSGITRSVKEESSSLSSEYGFPVGNSDAQISISKISNEPNSAFAKSINSPTYTPLINFNNQESKVSSFTINPNYNNYYFVSDSASAAIENLSSKEFEGYVANTGASSCSVGAQSVSSNGVAIIGDNGAISTTSLQTLPSASLDLKDTQDNQVVYLTSSFTITNSTSISSRDLEIVNDSSSSISLSYNSVGYSISANQTAVMSFTSSSATINYTKTNITVQDNSIYYPDTGFVNIDHSLAALNPAKTSNELPVYNASRNKLSVNGSLDLSAESFNILNWNGSSVTSSQKDIFDHVKIFLIGDESNDERVTLLKDDTEIIITNFDAPQNAQEEYFFIKDEAVTRAISIFITNGSSKYFLPIKNQDFKITVYKDGSDIIYKILYPSNSPFFEISQDLQQLVVLTENDVQSIDLNYLESVIPKEAFIYIVNKGQSSISFYKGDPSQSAYTVSPNQIARASIVTVGDANGIKIDILNSAYSHFAFDINPATHLSNSINILDLNFCGTSISIPAVANFASKNTFLLSRNRTVPNKIDNQFVSSEAGLINTEDNPTTNEVNEIGDLAPNSIALSLYKKNVSDTLPTLQRTSFASQIFSETAPGNDISAFFYIKEDSLNSFTIRDFYNRKTQYNGKVFLPSPREMRLNSFDDNHFYRTESDSISFDYNPDKYINGRLSCYDREDSIIISRDTEKASVAKTFPNALASDQILINFAYDTVNVTVSSVSKTLKKNRLIKNYVGNLIYPVYNSKEFFIAATNVNRSAKGTILYYEIVGKEMDVESIILPDSSAVVTYIIKNSSSRAYPIYTLSGLSVHSLAPNTQKEFVFNGASYNVNNNSTPYNEAIQVLSISVANQDEEADSDHPLSSLWASGFSINAIKNAFIGEGSDTSIELITDGSPYQYSLFDVLDTVPSSSSKTVYCYGRKSGVLDIGDNKYLVNGFYLFLSFNNTIVRENEFYTIGDDLNTAGAYPLSIVEYKHTDLLKYIQTYQSVIDLPNVILIPIVSQLTHYYLPNLSTTYSDGSQSYQLSSLLAGKKIIFVNMVKCSKDAKNKVTNYNTSTTEELSDINSLVMYEISGGQWQKVTSGLPVVTPVYAKLVNVKGRSTTQTSEISDGSEFVYLQNFNRFDVDINSFKDKEFKNFYLFNSASNRIFINSNQSMLSSNRFVKIYANSTSNSFGSEDIESSGSSPFALVEIQSSKFKTIDQMVAEQYPNLKFGTYLKVIENNGSGASLVKYTRFYSYDTSMMPSRVKIKNEFFVDLDLFNLKSYAPNSKLFVYGLSGIDQEGLSFDSYYLRLLRSETLQGQKFYIYNNSNANLQVYFKDSDTESSSDFVTIGARRMLEVSDKACFMETHEKGKYYIGNKKTNTSYINKIDLPIFVDSLADYQSLTSIIEKITIVENINSSIINLSKYKTRSFFYYYDDTLKDSIDFNSNSSLSLKTADNFYIKNASVRSIIKPNYQISSGGHYILNNSNSGVVVDFSGLSQDLFLVNNCAENIQLAFSNESKENSTIYRNTVAVINSAGEIRYLKKAKRRDEFYCVFNPKTAISTQNEIAFTYKLPRNEDVLPILNSDNTEQQSYIKLLSKNGSSSVIYLSIKDYYNGIDIPTNSPEGVVAYEVGLGHETISKFLFFDPSKSTYTLPGIVNGQTYRVDIDYGLFENLSNLKGENGKTTLEEPYVIYNGKIYRHNQKFQGSDSSFYEIKYPNYVKVFKVTEDQPADENLVAKENEDIDPSIQEQVVVPIDKNAIFYQIINESINESFGSMLSWIPNNEEAFWMTSNFDKDFWQIESVDSGSTKQFSYDDRQVTFTKCTLKKTDLRSLIASTKFEFYSALQERTVTRLGNQNTPADDLISLGDELNSAQKNLISQSLRRQDASVDYIIPNKEIYLGFINKNSLFPSDATSSQVSRTDFELNISIDKLKTLPSIKFEDFSKSKIIKILNKDL